MFKFKNQLTVPTRRRFLFDFSRLMYQLLSITVAVKLNVFSNRKSTEISTQAPNFSARPLAVAYINILLPVRPAKKIIRNAEALPLLLKN